MHIWQSKAFALGEPLIAEPVGDEHLDLRLPEGPVQRFRCIRIATLTHDQALWLASVSFESPVIAFYRRASAGALALLREAEISFVGEEDGRTFLRAPGLLVDRPARRSAQPANADHEHSTESAASRNPFAKRGSRVIRWLLLHPDRSFAVTELAAKLDLSSAIVSRTLRALELNGLVLDETGGVGRERRMRLRSGQAALDEWQPQWGARRISRHRWDIGAANPEAALDLIIDALVPQPGRWALGGVMGAASVKRVVEPADVLIWTTEVERETLREALAPTPVRGGRGTVEVAIAPDPWTVDLAQMRNGVPVADNVQLWLDCAGSGERAVEAASAIAIESGWR